MNSEYGEILEEYADIFPSESDKLLKIKTFLDEFNIDEVTDWNNFYGHIVASGFLYAKDDKKFLVMYHDEFKMFVYPGGHIDKNDKSPLDTAKREIEEESGISNAQYLNVSKNELVPFDIDIQVIKYNEKLHLKEHYHFDYRYFFVIKNIQDVKLDTSELSFYKWISVSEMEELFPREVKKLKMLLIEVKLAKK